MAKIQLLLSVVEDLRSLAESIQAMANAMLDGDAASAQQMTLEADTAPAVKPDKPEKKEPAITLEQVRSALVDKTHEGFTAEVQELLHKYGANKLSAIDPKHYADLLKDAEEIGNGT